MSGCAYFQKNGGLGLCADFCCLSKRVVVFYATITCVVVLLAVYLLVLTSFNCHMCVSECTDVVGAYTYLQKKPCSFVCWARRAYAWASL